MIKQAHFRTDITRENKIRELIFDFAINICSYPRLLIEVFIRREMGERYFNLVSAITVLILLAVCPFLIPGLQYVPWYQIIGAFWSWYAFLTAYGYFSWKRHLEQKRTPGVWDFARYSKSSGYAIDFFDSFLESLGLDLDIRKMEIFIEPAFPFLIGGLLYLIGQGPVGVLLMFCSLVYSVSNAAAYWNGDLATMKKIDRIIINQEYSEFYSMGKPVQRGVPHVRRPNFDELRGDLPAFMGDEPETVAR